jgi:acetyl-CoA acetyltransferase
MVGNAVQGAMDGQRDIRGQLMLRGLPLGTGPVVNVENACASASSALHLAVAYVGSGMADVVLAVGAEKMVSPDRQRSLDAFSGSWDESVRAETLGGLAVFGQGTPVPDGVEDLATRSVFMDAYASFARQHMARWAARSSSSPRWPPRTTGTRCTTRGRSTGARSPSRRCWAAGQSPGR